PADELHKLERRPPRLAGAALLATARPGPYAVSGRERAVRLRCARERAAARRDLVGVEPDHRGGRPVARRAHDPAAARGATARPERHLHLRQLTAAGDLPLLVPHRREHGDPPAARTRRAPRVRREHRRRSALPGGESVAAVERRPRPRAPRSRPTPDGPAPWGRPGAAPRGARPPRPPGGPQPAAPGRGE